MSDKTVALITGASSGIGEQYALQLAGRCDEMILVARREEALSRLAARLSQQVKCHVLAVDLTDPIGRGYVLEAIRQIGPIRYLINNAGFGVMGHVADLGCAEQQQMVELHITVTLALCRAAIPFMQQLGGGYIINVSSLAAVSPCPGVAVYGASKAFLNSFSQSLAMELENDNIKVQCLCPGYTRTGFHQTEPFAEFDASKVPDEMWMEAGDVVRESLEALAGNKVLVFAGDVNRQIAKSMLEGSVAQL